MESSGSIPYLYDDRHSTANLCFILKCFRKKNLVITAYKLKSEVLPCYLSHSTAKALPTSPTSTLILLLGHFTLTALETSLRRLSSPAWVGLIQSCEGLNRMKRLHVGGLSLCASVSWAVLATVYLYVLLKWHGSCDNVQGFMLYKSIDSS